MANYFCVHFLTFLCMVTGVSNSLLFFLSSIQLARINWHLLKMSKQVQDNKKRTVWVLCIFNPWLFIELFSTLGVLVYAKMLNDLKQSKIMTASYPFQKQQFFQFFVLALFWYIGCVNCTSNWLVHHSRLFSPSTTLW